ncbi:IQ calmodulin-binding motif-containing protein 1 [Megalops cyprinoides]|uniref:IQ calmodulin-binding motif-containing protein 1 n=1 Tax=Megalops cyprinoides TaxID=118141 RepID=UPI00186485F0|nr:IQ calmodulin-binding motif-containing protein 1 [Megalops cyprinoides]
MMSRARHKDVDPELQPVIAVIGSKSEQTVNDVLLKLKDVLGRKSVEDDRVLEKLKQDMHTHGILEYCSAALNYDYDNIQGGYSTAVQMAEIVSSCCVGFQPVRNKEIFQTKVLPSAADNLISLAKRLADRALKEKRQAGTIRQFQKVMDVICWLLKGHNQLILQVLHSKHFEEIQLLESEDIGVISLLLLQNLIQTNSDFLMDIRHGALSGILDDIVYKLGCSSNPATGSAATKTLLLIASKNRSIAEVIPNQYEGLDALLKNDWIGKGFDSEVKQLLDVLYPGVTKRKQTQLYKHSSEERVKAACVIQAAWRSFQTRRRLKKLSKAVSTLQRSFRERRRQQEEQSQRRRAEEELRHQVLLRRQRALREFRQRQLQLLEIVPADQVDRYLSDLELKAAVVIQKVWRGHRERRNFLQQKQELRQFKAAVTIQRAALRFLKRRRAARQTLSPWKGPKGLTDARRTELKKQVDDYIALHSRPSVSLETCRELHLRTQEMLRQHLMSRDADRRAEQHRQALLAQINTDVELLMNAPSLSGATETESSVFLSRSAPVAARARQSHNTLLQAARYPWWKKLGDEFLDPESIPKDSLDLELETLYLGGS